MLAEHPGLGRPSPVADGLRQLSFQSHVAFYHLEPSAVVVQRVLHKAMDPLRHLDQT